MKEYEVELQGIKHRFLLDDEDAAKLGDSAAEVKAAKAPANKSRTASNK